MGACDFIWTHRTKRPVDMLKAFNDAVANAQYEYGHRGYTGTLAEKQDVVFIARVKTDAEAYELANKLINEQDARIDDKWGPAGAIQFGERLLSKTQDEPYATGWLFFGMAPS